MIRTDRNICKQCGAPLTLIDAEWFDSSAVAPTLCPKFKYTGTHVPKYTEQEIADINRRARKIVNRRSRILSAAAVAAWMASLAWYWRVALWATNLLCGAFIGVTLVRITGWAEYWGYLCK